MLSISAFFLLPVLFFLYFHCQFFFLCFSNIPPLPSIQFTLPSLFHSIQSPFSALFNSTHQLRFYFSPFYSIFSSHPQLSPGNPPNNLGPALYIYLIPLRIPLLRPLSPDTTLLHSPPHTGLSKSPHSPLFSSSTCTPLLFQSPPPFLLPASLELSLRSPLLGCPYFYPNFFQAATYSLFLWHPPPYYQFPSKTVNPP